MCGCRCKCGSCECGCGEGYDDPLAVGLGGFLATYQLYFIAMIVATSYLVHRFDPEESPNIVLAFLIAKLVFSAGSFIVLLLGSAMAKRDLMELIISFGALIGYDRRIFSVYFVLYVGVAVLGSCVAFATDSAERTFALGTTIADYTFLSLMLGFHVYARGLFCCPARYH